MKKLLSIILWVVGILVLIAGAGGIAYHLGYTRGVVENPVVAEQLQTWQNQSNNLASPYSFRGNDGSMMFRGHTPLMLQGRHFGLNLLFVGLGFLFLAFLFFGAMRFFFFRHMMHPYGPWHGHMPPWAQQPAPQAPAQPEPPKATDK